METKKQELIDLIEILSFEQVVYMLAFIKKRFNL